MEQEIVSKLLDVNRQFYQTFGADFSATRGRIQPGVRRILGAISLDDSILDLGCGNGELARQLAQRGQRGPYLGLDFSLPLLSDAARVPDDFPANFLAMDIADGQWPGVRGGWSVVTAFAVLHHIPGDELRTRILRNVHARLAPGGRFILSNWQFLNSERLRARLQDWREVGLTPADVDEGDHLLDWRHGGRGLRYVHHFSESELAGLAAVSGFRVDETFYSDGEGGRLGLYQVWQKDGNTA
ncbi:MAG: class I SAM-dependent methyltransferase [Chloroflexi bacterium]|nr:class I SAM-dependent methyltransferase [Chloroflexota bacterium]